jgi:hypothetical protein
MEENARAKQSHATPHKVYLKCQRNDKCSDNREYHVDYRHIKHAIRMNADPRRSQRVLIFAKVHYTLCNYILMDAQ